MIKEKKGSDPNYSYVSSFIRVEDNMEFVT